MLLYCISRTTRLSNIKSDGIDFKGHSSQQIHINSSESSSKGPDRRAPLIWSNFKHLIFVNDPVLNKLFSDALAVNYWRQASPTMCKWDYLISHLAHGGGLPLTPINCILMPPPPVMLCGVYEEHREQREKHREKREQRRIERA
jgi:hypothetical protein